MAEPIYFRVCWRLVGAHPIRRGSPVLESAALQAVEQGNRDYPAIRHWVERVGPESVAFPRVDLTTPPAQGIDQQEG